MRSLSMLLLAVLVSTLIALGTAAFANIMFVFPGASPGGPYYARVERGPGGSPLVPHDEAWAAIVFYRQPDCVPAGFNLLNFFHVPAAFGCTLTVEGFEIWRNGPASDLAPIHVSSYGMGAVPVWLVEWWELQAAIIDDVLTMPELQGLATLRKGSASFFKETLHPDGGAQQTKLQIGASGLLEDGQAFRLHSEENNGQLNSVIIQFK